MDRKIWASIVKGNAKYKCQVCGSTELIQAHDPTHSHSNPLDGIALCAEHHSQQHPNIPHNLFFNKRMQPYWDNISASSLAKHRNVHPRTIIRQAKKLGIHTGVLSDTDKEILLNSLRQQRHIKTTTVSLRMPKVLWEHIGLLANKRKWSINSWISNTLERESTLR